MKRMSLALAAGLLIGLTGCGDTGKGGAGDKKLKVTGPGTAVSVKPGATEQFTVSVARTNFDDDVTLDFKGLPDGVTVEDPHKIDKGVKEKKFTLKADKDAKENDGGKEATITAKSGSITTDPAKFTVKVKK